MSDRVQLDSEHSGLILARDSQIGEKYRSRTGVPVIVKEKGEDQVLVTSLITGNDVTISMDYPLIRLMTECERRDCPLGCGIGLLVK